MHAKSRAHWQTAVYRSIDNTCVANQRVYVIVARLRDSRSLRYANPYYIYLHPIARDDLSQT